MLFRRRRLVIDPNLRAGPVAAENPNSKRDLVMIRGDGLCRVLVKQGNEPSQLGRKGRWVSRLRPGRQKPP